MPLVQNAGVGMQIIGTCFFLQCYPDADLVKVSGVNGALIMMRKIAQKKGEFLFFSDIILIGKEKVVATCFFYQSREVCLNTK